jgi:hypothetical protein
VARPPARRALLQSATANAFVIAGAYSRKRYGDARLPGSETTRLMLDELASEFVSPGMREVQEESIKAIIQARTDQLIAIFDFSADTVKTFNALSAGLGQTLRHSTEARSSGD